MYIKFSTSTRGVLSKFISYLWLAMTLRNEVHPLPGLPSTKTISPGFATPLKFLRILNSLPFLPYPKMCINVSGTLKKETKASGRVLMIFLTPPIPLTVKFSQCLH